MDLSNNGGLGKARGPQSWVEERGGASRSALHRFEESLIALILGVMTVLTFIQVVLRYGFNSGFIWALEADFYLFAWMVLLGISC